MGGYIGSRAVNLSTTAADVSGNATIGGNLTVSGTTVTIDSANAQTVDLGDNDKIRLGDGDDLQIYHDASNSHISNATGNLTLDVAGNIILDADSAEIIFKDGGTSFGRVFNSSGNFYINAPTADTDIIIQGNDGGSNVNALSFDMSAAGAATFNSTITSGAITSSGVITANDYIDLNNSGNRGKIGYDSNNVYLGSTSGTGEIHFKNNIGSTDAPHSSGDTKMVITDTGVGIGTSSITSGFMLDVIGDARFSDAAGDDAVELGWSGGGSVGFVQAYDRGASAFRDLSLNNAITIKSSGNVGIGTSSITSTASNRTILEVNGASTSLFNMSIGGTRKAYIYHDDASFYIANMDNTPMQFHTNNTERFRCDSDGRMGFGVVNMSSYYSGKFVISAGDEDGVTIVGGTDSQNYIMFADGTSGDARYKGYISYDHDIDAMKLATNGSTRLQIDSSGRLMVGTTTEGNPASDDLTLSGSGHVGMTIRSTDSSSSRIYFSDATSGTGEYVGYMIYDHPVNAMIFGTSSTEHMRIDSSGNVGFSTTNTSIATSNSEYGLMISGGGRIFSTINNDHHDLNRASGNGELIRCRRGGTQVGSISVTLSATAFNTSSDYRLKTDAKPITGATDRIKQLNPVNFKWIVDDTRADGFIAHEAEAVVPEAITGAKDAVDADGNPVYQGIDQSKLVPLLVATIKELEARITTLESN